MSTTATNLETVDPLAQPDRATIPPRNDAGSLSLGDEEASGDINTSNGDTLATQPTNPLLVEDQMSSIVFAGGASDINDAVKDHSQNSTTWYKKSCKEVIAPAAFHSPTGGKGLLAQKDIRVDLGPDKVPTVFASNDILWNGTPQVISYFFLDGNDLQHQKVEAAIQEWTWYANVVFHQAASAQDSNVRIRFDPEDGSWSYVGRQCDHIDIKAATMNLAWLDKFSPLTANERAVILHEFGHTLGLLHEHQSPAHGGFAVTNVQAAIELYSKTQGWSTQQIYDQVINVYKMSDVSNFSQVDTTSIMHYPQPKELTGLAEDIPYNSKLSRFDKAYMMLQYPRREIHPQAQKQGWSYGEALKVIGAPPEVTTTVLKLLGNDRDEVTREISPLNIRQVIERWCREAHKGQSDAPQGWVPGPAHGIQRSPVEDKSSHIIDALQKALSDEEVARWLRSQPEGTREKLRKKLGDVFGSVGVS